MTALPPCSEERGLLAPGLRPPTGASEPLPKCIHTNRLALLGPLGSSCDGVAPRPRGGAKIPGTCVSALGGRCGPACLQRQRGLAAGWFGLLSQLWLLRLVGLNQLWLCYPDQLKTEFKAQRSESRTPSRLLGQGRALVLPAHSQGNRIAEPKPPFRSYSPSPPQVPAFPQGKQRKGVVR